MIHEYEFVDGAKTSVHGTLEYGEMQQGFPALRRFIHTKTQAPESGGQWITTKYDFEKIDFVEVPDRDFTLAAFGLPELGRPTERSSRSPAPWLIALSLLALAAAVVLKVASSRIQRKKRNGRG